MKRFPTCVKDSCKARRYWCRKLAGSSNLTGSAVRLTLALRETLVGPRRRRKIKGRNGSANLRRAESDRLCELYRGTRRRDGALRFRRRGDQDRAAGRRRPLPAATRASRLSAEPA